MSFYKNRLFLFTVFFVFPFIVFSQEASFLYLPKNKDSIINYVNQISEKKITKFGNRYTKEIKENITERKEHFIKKIEDSTFIFNDKINNYLNAILKNIYAGNSSIEKSDFFFFIDKSSIPNAACYGNGIFTVNLGLFNFVTSDDELAFILCHEIGHYTLEHTDKSLLKYIELTKDKAVKKRINEVKKKEYGKRKAYSDLMQELSYDFLKRSRKVELEADSLGLLYFKKTKYNSLSSCSSLKNLELSDTLVFNQEAKLRAHFNFKEYPFKEGWLLKEESLFDISESSDDYTLNKDSLKTHPDIPLRIEKLNDLMLKNGIKNEVAPEMSRLNEIKKIVALISVTNFVNNNQFDLALYQCLTLYNQQEMDKKAYVLVVSNLLERIYKSKESHTFGKYVSPISSFSDELHLNEVKQFLHNIELKNIRKIGLNFCLENESFMGSDPDFNKTLTYFKKINL